MQETREQIVNALADGPISGPALADRLDISRTAVWKHVEHLREKGFDIDSGDAGYELAGVSGFGGIAIEYGLDAPFTIEYHDSIDSTNQRARELATAGESDVVVLADEQTGGRGRLDREWASPSGGVWLSFVLRPEIPVAHAPVFTLTAAVAVTRAAREAGVEAGIKWPNDVVIGDREAKLAGILTEVEGEADRVEWVVVGIGINANIDETDLPPSVNATSIQREVGPVDRRVFTQRLVEEFDELRSDVESVVDAWREHATTLGQRVRVETPGDTIEGMAVGVTFPGALAVDTGEERVTVTAGDCEHLRPV
ncbi:biotin--[acetyl-CoA-carboxylase] ligase [Halobacteriales archaeon QS_4_62_28]|nr:MAG: biotin--[acetyl-CoA-carboxylase] ligase [Halobacteriales archaeon QS_4_62_28]